MTSEHLTPEALDTIEARANAATEGPWRAMTTGVSGGDHWYIVDGGQSVAYVSASDGENEDQREPDAEFIAHAREDIPALVAEIRRLLTENEEQAAVIEQARQHNAQFEVDHSGHHHDPDSAFTCYGEQSWTTAEARDLGMILAKAPVRAALTGEATE